MGDITQEQIVYTGLIIALLIAGYFWYRKDILFLFKKKESEGVIVNWMSTVEKGKRYYYPMIEFTPEGREKVTFRADERCEDKPMYEPGTRVTIKYLESDIEYRKVIYPA